MIRNIYIIYCLFYPCIGFSQWQSLSSGLNYGAGYDMLFDSSTNLIYVGGDFNYADGIYGKCIATWNGSSWDSLGRGAEVYPVTAITKYNGKIFASAKFYYQPFPYANYLAWWNGQYWDTLNEHVNSTIYAFKEYNNELYFGGSFDKIGNQNAMLLAKLNGVNFTPISLPSESGGYTVRAIEFYQGFMYVGGNFYDTLSSVHDLERWDGNSFQPFGGNGLAVGGDYVSSMVIYNNELYIAGGFNTITGSPGDDIMRWDGNQFHDVGGGVNAMIRRMKIFNGILYISGDFTMAGNVPIHNFMAKWNGLQWSEVFPDTLDNIITDFIVVNNDLYITGGFTTINNVPFNHIARYPNYVSVPELPEKFQINISPNPANSIISLTCNHFISAKLKIENILGQEFYKKKMVNNNIEIDISFLPDGIYFLSAENKNGKIVKKFVKQ